MPPAFLAASLPRIGVLVATLCVCVGNALGADVAAQAPERDLARQILSAASVHGGLIVHLGCATGKLTAALDAGESRLIHGLDTDAANVRRARAYLRQLGLYGRISAERLDGNRLPYVDNLVNLLVAENLGGVTTAEALRVLVPGGVLYAMQDGRWQKTVKPRPDDIDQWTHFLHDASGNAVAHDAVVGPPGRMQWSAGPRYTRSHEHTPSIFALVASGGRIVYVADEAPIASIRAAPQWRLVARDAFNGMLLWKKPIDRWYPHIINWGQTPPQLQRRLVVDGDRIYATLGLHASLSVVDAATGQTLDVFEHTHGTEEIVCHNGVLLVAVRGVADERVAEFARWANLGAARQSPLYVRETAEPLVKRFRATEAKGAKSVLALDTESGLLLWNKSGPDVSRLRTLTLCAAGERVFYQNGQDVVCLDLKTGQQQWSRAAPPLRTLGDGALFCADGKRVTAFSVETGQPRWSQPALVTQIRDVFVAGGSLWVGGFKPIERKGGPSWGPYVATQRDLATGEKLRHIEPENPGHHHRCYTNKATDRYILAGRRGTEFIDLQSGDVLWNSWARGVCRYGVMPCNGLLYVPPHPCACYVTAKLTGFNVMAPASRADREQWQVRRPLRIERGPAYAMSPQSRQPDAEPLVGWPTYRCDAERSGFTPSTLSAELRPRWQVPVGGRLTAPIAQGGKVFVASTDEHAVSAIDADMGRPIWSFTAGARVDSPPTLYRDRVLFGCRDGYAYSLRASDGALAWRLQAARAQQRFVADGQLESVSPLHGSVLVRHGVVYLTAGRSSYLDGGIDLYRVEPGTGETLSRTPIYSPDPETGRQPPQSAPSAMPGARWDILTSDGDRIYLRDMVFDFQGHPQDAGNPHLFTLTDFLDTSWAHRSYWIFGTQCSIATGCSRRDRSLVYGRLIVFDDAVIYGFGRATVHWSNQLQDGPYRLFAVKRGDSTEQWTTPLPIRARAMLLADRNLFVAGLAMEEDQRPRPLLLAVSASDGSGLAQYRLDSPPVFDGMAAADGRLYVSLENGQVVCMDSGR